MSETKAAAKEVIKGKQDSMVGGIIDRENDGRDLRKRSILVSLMLGMDSERKPERKSERRHISTSTQRRDSDKRWKLHWRNLR